MSIPFLSLKDVTALHGEEINEAISRVVNGGCYMKPCQSLNDAERTVALTNQF